MLGVSIGFCIIAKRNGRMRYLCLGGVVFGAASLIWLTGHTNCNEAQKGGRYSFPSLVMSGKRKVGL
jgi:hypothetical protein